MAISTKWNLNNLVQDCYTKYTFMWNLNNLVQDCYTKYTFMWNLNNLVQDCYTKYTFIYASYWKQKKNRHTTVRFLLAQ